MRSIILLSLFSLVALMVACSESFTDPRDGQSYDIVQIGSQTWMAENLNYEAEGSACPEGDKRNCSKYGRLYTWEVAQKVCPEGWHLPDSADFEQLIASAGGMDFASEKLKSTSGWRNGDNGTGEYSFSALPAVYKSFNEGFFAFFWSSTEYSDDEAYYMKLFYDYDGVFLYNDDKSVLKSVRCVKD